MTEKQAATRRISLGMVIVFTMVQFLPTAGFADTPQPLQDASSQEFDHRKSISYEGSSEPPPISEVRKDPQSWENFLNGSPLRTLDAADEKREKESEIKLNEKDSVEVLTASQKMRAERSFRQALEQVTVRETTEGVLMETVFFKALNAAVDALILQEVKPEVGIQSLVTPEVALEAKSQTILPEPVPGMTEDLGLSPVPEIPGPPSSPELERKEQAAEAAVVIPDAEPVMTEPLVREETVAQNKIQKMEMEPSAIIVAASEQSRKAREENLESLMQKLDDYLKQKIAEKPAAGPADYSQDVDRLVDSFVEKVQSAAGEVARKIREFYLPERARRQKVLRRVVHRGSRGDLKNSIPVQPEGLLSREISTLLPVAAGAVDIVQTAEREERVEDLPADTQFLLRFMGIEHFHPWVSILMNQRMSVREKDELRKMLERMMRPNGDEENAADARYRNNHLKLGIAHLAIAQAVTGNMGPYLPPGLNHQAGALDEQREKILAKSNKLYGRRPSRD